MSDLLSYDVKGAARALSLSTATIWRLIQRREIPTFKIGARTLIDADDLRAFKQRQVQASRAA